MKMSFKLEVFEGPLDLLLHLIAKHKLNINDIPIMILVEQYLNYISDMAEQDMEVAGDFLEMAARLIYIKTVSLLPRKEEAEALKFRYLSKIQLLLYNIFGLITRDFSQKNTIADENSEKIVNIL